MFMLPVTVIAGERLPYEMGVASSSLCKRCSPGVVRSPTITSKELGIAWQVELGTAPSKGGSPPRYSDALLPRFSRPTRSAAVPETVPRIRACVAALFSLPGARFIICMSPSEYGSAWLGPRGARFGFARHDTCSAAGS